MTTNGKSDKTGKPAKTKATKAELRAWQEALPEDQTTCRDLQHAWIYQSVKREANGFTRQLGCLTCGAFKLQHLDRQGYIIRSSYEYPEGYIRPHGAGRITSEENAFMRLLSLKMNRG